MQKLTDADGGQKELPGGERLEVSPSLLAFMRELESRPGGKDCPMTMLNLLHFQPGGKPSYFKYGQAFKEVAGKRGGDAKIVGNVVQPPANVEDARAGKAESEWWNEVSIVHYPRYAGLRSTVQNWTNGSLVFGVSVICWQAVTTRPSTRNTDSRYGCPSC